MKDKIPFVSVVMPTFNGLEILKVCLPSVLNQSYPKGSYEVIVVDNASEDGTVEYIRKKYPKIKIVQNKKNMGYVGINSALGLCMGKYVYFINNDITMNRDCIKNLIKVIEKDDSIAMAVHNTVNYYNKKLVSGGTWASRAMYCGHYPQAGKSNKPIEIPYMGGGLIRKSVIDKFGYLFDPDYFIYVEDLDLGLRIRLIGMKVMLVFDAMNFHMHALTMKKYSSSHRNAFLLERNTLMTFFKVFSIKTMLLLFPYILLMRAASVLRDLAAFRLKSAFARVKAVLWVIFNFGLIAGKRKVLQGLRAADDRYLLKVFTEKYLFKKQFIV